jgi:hypothetical protein
MSGLLQKLYPSHRHRCLVDYSDLPLNLLNLIVDDLAVRSGLVSVFVQRESFSWGLREIVSGQVDLCFSNRMQRIHPNCCPLSLALTVSKGEGT